MIRSNPNQAEHRCPELVEVEVEVEVEAEVEAEAEAEAEAVLDSTEKQDSSGQTADLRVEKVQAEELAFPHLHFRRIGGRDRTCLTPIHHDCTS